MKKILLTRGLYAVVDDEDYDTLSQWSWYARPGYGTYYAERRGPRDAEGKRVAVSMHRTVMGCESGDGTIVDHINRDGLDNRRINLRFTDKRGNALNSDHALDPMACPVCEEVFQPKESRRKFCSISCARRQPGHGRSQRQIEPKPCSGCGHEFTPYRRRVKTCSPECATTSRAKARGWV